MRRCRLRRQDARRLGAVVGAGGHHCGASIFRIVVQPCEAAEHARSLAVNFQPDIRRWIAAGDDDQLFRQHRVGQAAGELERRQQRRRAADVVGDAAAHAETVAIANEPVTRPVAAADHAFQVIDGILHQLGRLHDLGSAQTGLYRRRQIVDAGVTGPRRPRGGNQLLHRGTKALIVGDRGRFHQQHQPRRATEHRLVHNGSGERVRKRQPERLAQPRGVGFEIPSEQQRGHRRVDRLLAGDGSDDADGHGRQLGDSGILQGRNYNERMIVVRYLTLVALVIWIGAMVDQRFGDLFRRPQLVAYICGGAIVVGLFALKFLGPPPSAFVVRAGITVLMLVTAAATALIAPRDLSGPLTALNICLGFILLIWYVRE
jgi:hypothetical protein